MKVAQKPENHLNGNPRVINYRRRSICNYVGWIYFDSTVYFD